MKKSVTVWGMCFLLSLAFIGCEKADTMEKDAEELAKLYCSGIELREKTFGSLEEGLDFDENALKDFFNKSEKQEALIEEILAKYSEENVEELQVKAMNRMGELCQ